MRQAAMPEAPDRWMTHPSLWLVHGVEWPGGGLAEGAVAYVPEMFRRFRPADAPEGVSRGLNTVLLLAEKFAGVKRVRVVFFAEITRWLAVEHDATWERLKVNWSAVLDEMDARAAAAMYLTISQRAHLFICDAAISLHIVHSGGRTELATAEEHELVRESVHERLAADWPAYIRERIARGILPSAASA